MPALPGALDRTANKIMQHGGRHRATESPGRHEPRAKIQYWRPTLEGASCLA